MTELIRKIEYRYLKSIAAGTAGQTGQWAPWLVRELMPSKHDEGGLSVFEIDNRSTALTVAAAFGLGSEKIETCCFLCADTSELRSAGLSISSTKGKTNHIDADDIHREIIVRRVEEALLLADIFLKREPISYDPEAIKKEIHLSFDNQRYKVRSFFENKSLDHNWSARNIFKFIGSGELRVLR